MRGRGEPLLEREVGGGASLRYIARLVTALEPDEKGRVKLTLQANDLLVIDEAGMITTPDLDRVTMHAARAGAKVIWAGDHHQLPAVGAGGMFD